MGNSLIVRYVLPNIQEGIVGMGKQFDKKI